MVKYTISNKGVKLKDLYNDESKWLARGKTLQIYEDEQVDINEDFLTKFAADPNANGLQCLYIAGRITLNNLRSIINTPNSEITELYIKKITDCDNQEQKLLEVLTMGSLKRVVIEDMAGIKNDKLYKDWLDHLRTNTSMEEAGIFYKEQKDVSTIDYYNNKNYPEVINSAKAMVEDNNHLVWFSLAPTIKRVEKFSDASDARVMKDAYYWDDIVYVFQGSRSLCFVARESGEISWKSENLMRTTSHNSTLAANVATIIYKYFTDNNLEDINLKLIDSNSMSAIKCLPKVNQIILEKELSKAAKDSQRADKIIKQVIGYHEAKKAEEDFKINFLLAKDVGKTILPELSHAAVTSYPIGIKDSEFLENESNNPENPEVIWLENNKSNTCPLSRLNRDCSLHISKYLSELPTTEEDFETVLSFTEASYSYDNRGLWEGDVQPALVVTEDSYDLEDWSFDSDSDCAPPLNAQPSHVQSVLVSGDSISYSDLYWSDFE